MPAKATKPDATPLTDYRIAQELAKFRIQLNQYGVLLSTVSEQLKGIAGMEARLAKKIDDAVLTLAPPSPTG